MKEKRKILKESEQSFDYTQIKFPQITRNDVTCEDIDGNIYYFSVNGFEDANKSLLKNEDSLISFVVEANAYGKWVGSYWPGNREEPPEYPEYEIIDSDASLKSIEENDSDSNWLDKIPSKEQIIKDGNEKWYNEYLAFVNVIEYIAEDMECDRVLEDPPEQEEYDDDDYDWERDEFEDRYSNYDESIDSIEGDIKERAKRAAKLLGMIAYLGDSELDKKQKMFKMQNNIRAQEMADAIDDIKAYREESKKLTSDRKNSAFAGSTREYVEESRGQKSQREMLASIINFVYDKALNPGEYILHHIDGSHANNSIDNLSLVRKDLHNKLHIEAKRNAGIKINQKMSEVEPDLVNEYKKELIRLFNENEDGENYISLPKDVWTTIQNDLRNAKPDSEDMNPQIDVSQSENIQRLLTSHRK